MQGLREWMLSQDALYVSLLFLSTKDFAGPSHSLETGWTRRPAAPAASDGVAHSGDTQHRPQPLPSGAVSGVSHPAQRAKSSLGWALAPAASQGGMSGPQQPSSSRGMSSFVPCDKLPYVA